MLNFDEPLACDGPAIRAQPAAQPAALAATVATAGTHLPLGLLQAVLNQVDYGLAVVDAQTHRLIFANAQAQSALHPGGTQTNGLCVAHGFLRARDPLHAESLSTALAKTADRVRGLLRLGGGSSELTVAVIPLAVMATTHATHATHAHAHAQADDEEYDYVDQKDVPKQEPNLALLVFAKQQMCDTTTVTLFARESGLTSAEGQVLAQVCKGLRPAQIATHQGVQVSTVRTQLRAIRHKTASDSMRELVRKVSTLPPVARYLPGFLGGVDSGFAA